MGLKRLAVGGGISSILLSVGTGLVFIDRPAHGIPWVAGGVSIGVMAVLAYWRGRQR